MLHNTEIQVERERETERVQEIWCHVCIRVFVYVVEVDFDQRLTIVLNYSSNQLHIH